MNGCTYCVDKETILQTDATSAAMIQWMDSIDQEALQAAEYQLGIFIDRGYLRMADLDDCQCLDHGMKIKIHFCPFCGCSLAVKEDV